MKNYYLIILCVVLLTACSGPQSDAAHSEEPKEGSSEVTDSQTPDKDGAYVVSFRGRDIDLEPYVQGFPYSRFFPFVEHGHLIYFHTTPEGKWMNYQQLGSLEIDPSKGKKITDIDWSTRNFWGGQYHAASDKFYIMGDESNQERINVYMLDIGAESYKKFTDNDYTYGFGFSNSEKQIAYVARRGQAEPFISCLHLRNIADGTDQEVICDQGGADRFTWSDIEFLPDDSKVVLRMQHDGDRNKTSLVSIDLTEPAFDFLFEREVLRYGTWVVSHSLTEQGMIYGSAEDGFDNLYSYDFTSRTSKKLTNFVEEMGGNVFVGGEEEVIMVVLRRPHESELVVVDAQNGALLFNEVVLASVRLKDSHEQKGVFSLTGINKPFGLEEFSVSKNEGSWTVSRQSLAGIPSDLEQRIIHCEVNKVSYPTFDTVKEGDAQRMLHAYYMTPKNPPPESDRLVAIKSFYGGANSFRTGNQIWCEAGIATFSPAPRGSGGFGAEFAALNDGDLGGDEIVDVIYAAKWLEKTYGYSAEQIGVFGGSHGGYATMRLLTFPPETNGRNESYNFGFGLSMAGFSDILTFYETCNIPDWVVLEAGDPKTEKEKLMDRSPINHVELLQTPLLLVHGENDNRVPVTESRRFAEKAKELNKNVTYVEFAGQGHGIDGLDNTLNYYRAVFAFFSQLVDPK